MNVVAKRLSGLPGLTWLAVGLGLVLAAAAAAALWHLRSDALDGQARELRLLSLALTDDLDRGLQGVEEGLHAIRNELRAQRMPATGEEAGEALRTRAELMPLIETLWLVDGSGTVLSTSGTAPAPELPSFSPPLARLAENALAVSRPFEDAGAREPMVALAFRFAPAQGAGAGWMLAALPARELLGAFSVAAPSADARMAVFRDDGARLAGSIVAEPTLDEAGVAQRLASLHSLEVRRFRDGSERLVSVHPLSHFGLSVVMTRDLDAVLAPWRLTARLTAAGIVILLAILTGSAYLLQRAARQNAQAQRALQAQLARASKLEALGTLAGGVAHDFNNVLAAIVGYGELAQDEAPPASDQARQLDRVLKAAARGKALVERILAFSRGAAQASIVFELEPVVDEALTLLAASLRPGVVLERGLDASGARLRGDPTQIFEVVMNLCMNAMQALPDGGMMSVRLQRHRVVESRVLSHSRLAPGNYVALTVMDEGQGVAPEVMERLFEPFFTTRRAQSGTGLGLAVVHGVVAEFGGAVDVQSTVGRGSRFTLYFPESTEAPGAPAPAPAATPRGERQKLLVVDDEPVLVGLAQEMLTGLGYEPVGFSDPNIALQALREQPQRFAAVITDEVMPGLNGTRLTEQLRAIAPDLPVLLVSGYGGALLAARAAAVGVTRVLAKPLQRADLARALAELLR